ncbi:MAG: GntR family transcriptional regulator [Anaerovoracaceae bacterium]
MFEIDQRSHKSICDQIIDNYKELIVCNVLKTNNKLPSVRELSRELTVNPNTVQKAYKQLEEQKYIYTSKGKGTFVSDEYEGIVDTYKVDDIRKRLEDNLNKLYYLGFSVEKIREIVNEILSKRGGLK